MNNCPESKVSEVAEAVEESSEKRIVVESAEENSTCNAHRDSLLVLQNLDNVLDNEYIDGGNKIEGETSDETSSTDQDKSKFHLYWNTCTTLKSKY